EERGDASHRRRARRPGGQVMPAKASRAAFGEALLELGARDDRIVTVDADLSKSTMTTKFAKTYPERAFNVGIAESNMVGIGAGLALTGKVPFVCSFACFVVGRFEPIRMSVAYTQANVKLVGTHCAVAIGEDGYSQMGGEGIEEARTWRGGSGGLPRAGGQTGHVATVEEHSIAGGLGGAVAGTLGEVMAMRMKRLGVQGFGESGDAQGLYANRGLDPAGI